MPETPLPFVLTAAAAQMVKSLLDHPGREALMLRIAVVPGGCRSFRYDLYTDDRTRPGDELLDFLGARVVLDEASAGYLRGARMDFVDLGEQRGFTIENPNARGGCGGGGCGGHGHGEGRGGCHHEG